GGVLRCPPRSPRYARARFHAACSHYVHVNRSTRDCLVSRASGERKRSGRSYCSALYRNYGVVVARALFGRAPRAERNGLRGRRGTLALDQPVVELRLEMAAVAKRFVFRRAATAERHAIAKLIATACGTVNRN